ncbi:MAG: hypothetical protein RXS42_08150 [Nitrososphaeria archaeon]
MQRLGPALGSIGADPREVRRIFIDETMVNLGGTPAWIWVALEPDLRAMLDFHVARAGTRSMPICSSGEAPHSGGKRRGCRGGWTGRARSSRSGRGWA